MNILRNVRTILPKLFASNGLPSLPKSLSVYPARQLSILNPQSRTPESNDGLLVPQTNIVNQTCGMKIKGWLKRRCKDCYFKLNDSRLYVMCRTHPRHKQMAMVPKPKNTWILAHATQSKYRPW